ncbi:MAG TPA: DUF3182 family protein [Casimicrobiaceae bacterium]|nr:DUF3182 family protein [Casimicrobiaceae bacterium]
MPESDASAASIRRAGMGRVLVYTAGSHRALHDHETCRELARLLAAIKGYDFAGEYDRHASYEGDVYFVPTDTLIGIDHARSLGIASEHDLFGGVVPYPFVATKCISHPLVDEHARVPEGWSRCFADAVRDAVLEGFSAFAPDDAMRAGSCLLPGGPVRVKRALGIGGHGQAIVSNRGELERALADVDVDEMMRYGISIEEHLDGVTTHSVGQARLDDLVASYFGTQRLTHNNNGKDVYGGSDLIVARGDFDALLAMNPPPAARHAVEKARRYDRAAFECFRGIFASRRNYDVVEGIDSIGATRIGVLEQSWRVGGASAAEVAALAAFRDDPSLRAVRASSVEVYGDAAWPPPGATVYFRGTDDHGGALTKYCTIDRDVHT